MASRAPSTPSAARTPRAAPNAPRKPSLDDIERALEAHITDAKTTFTHKNVSVTIGPGFPHFRAYQLFTQLTDLVPATPTAPVQVPYRKGVSYRQASRPGLYDEARNLIVPNNGSTFSLQGNGVSVTLAAGMPFTETYNLFNQLMDLAPPPPPVFRAPPASKLCRDGDACRYKAVGTCRYTHPTVIPLPPPGGMAAVTKHRETVCFVEASRLGAITAQEKAFAILLKTGRYSEAYASAYELANQIRESYNSLVTNLTSSGVFLPGWPKPAWLPDETLVQPVKVLF